MVASAASDSGFIEPVALLELLEDVVGPDDGVLEVRSAFTLEAQGLVDVERR